MRDLLHRFIDECWEPWYAKQLDPSKQTSAPTEPPTDQPTEPVPEARVLPEGKRAVRTKSQGDKVYILDEAEKTKRWAATPAVLRGFGFELADVGEVEENEFMTYKLQPTLYESDVPGAPSAPTQRIEPVARLAGGNAPEPKA